MSRSFLIALEAIGAMTNGVAIWQTSCSCHRPISSAHMMLSNTTATQGIQNLIGNLFGVRSNAKTIEAVASITAKIQPVSLKPPKTGPPKQAKPATYGTLRT